MGIGALFVVVTFVMAFPSVARFRTATPGDYGDTFLYQYLLRWDVHSLFDGGGNVFDPTYFWPYHNTLLYSDTVLAVAPVAGLLAALVGWTAAFNLVYIGSWIASLGSTYALARWCRASRGAAVLAAFVFTFAAVRLGHYAHFQLLFVFFIPLTLWLLLRFLTEGKWWQPVAVGVCCAAVFLNTGYTAVALATSLVVVVLGWVVTSRFRVGWRTYAGLGVIAVVTGVLLWPVLDGYQSLGSFLHRAYDSNQAVELKSYLAPATGSLFYGGLERWAKMDFEKRLFPGFLALALAVVGVVSLVRARHDDLGPHPHTRPRRRKRLRRTARARYHRRHNPESREPDLRRRGLVIVLLSTIPAFLLAFGKSAQIFGWRVTLPYSWVHTVPGFATIRAFGRFAVVPLLAVALLAAVGYDRLVRGRSRAVALGVAVALGAVMLVEYKAEVNMSDRIDRYRFTAVNQALAALPDDGAVVELPMGADAVWGFVESPRMVLSTIDWKPRVGGYSGYPAPNYGQTVFWMNSLDDGGPARPEALDLLDRFRVRYIVIRLAPVDETWDLAGATYEDEGGAQTILRALPPERVEGVTREGAAMLIRLRPGSPPASRP
ncbi:MAG: hypothetical protein ACRD12_24190 [Acidimicrobiales bacterium]